MGYLQRCTTRQNGQREWFPNRKCFGGVFLWPQWNTVRYFFVIFSNNSDAHIRQTMDDWCIGCNCLKKRNIDKVVWQSSFFFFCCCLEMFFSCQTGRAIVRQTIRFDYLRSNLLCMAVQVIIRKCTRCYDPNVPANISLFKNKKNVTDKLLGSGRMAVPLISSFQIRVRRSRERKTKTTNMDAQLYIQWADKRTCLSFI
jgi:hypothetical protein